MNDINFKLYTFLIKLKISYLNKNIFLYKNLFLNNKYLILKISNIKFKLKTKTFL